MSTLREKIIRDFTDCAKIENFRLGPNGELNKREGYLRLGTFESPIRGAVSDGDAFYIVSADGFYVMKESKLTLKGTLDGAVFSSDDEKVIIFIHGSMVFIMGGGVYYRYDIATDTFIQLDGYAPVLGTTDSTEDAEIIEEPLNLLTSIVRRRFRLVPTQFTYSLPEKAVRINRILLNGAVLDSILYNVDKVNNSISVIFDSSVVVQQEGVIEIEYVIHSSVFTANPSKITGCKKSYLFSSDAASVLFLYDSPYISPGHIIYSKETAAPTDSSGSFDYFPDERVLIIGDGTKPIRAITQLGDRTIAITSDGVYDIRVSTLSSGDVRFYTSRLYSELGASENSGAVVYENYLFFMNETGLFRLSYDSVTGVYRITQIDIPESIVPTKGLYKSIKLHINRSHGELWCYMESGIAVYSIRYQKWYRFSGITADFFFNVNARTAFVCQNKLNIFGENIYTDADGGFEAFIESKNLSFGSVFTEKTIYAFGAAFERREGAVLECLLVNDKGNEFHTVIESDGSGQTSPIVLHTHARLGKSAYIIYRISSPDYAPPANLREIMFRYRTTGV
ncbi:MAG: hypothetical protein IJY93_07825 [Clostridia bacterium]|nr:hypothetical protein [Clostridia bacterium]